jgi:branched-chain amino acid transport system permease protein
MLIYGLVLVIIMVVRPEGIMGTHELTFSYIKSLFCRKKKVAEQGGAQ